MLLLSPTPTLRAPGCPLLPSPQGCSLVRREPGADPQCQAGCCSPRFWQLSVPRSSSSSSTSHHAITQMITRGCTRRLLPCCRVASHPTRQGGCPLLTQLPFPRCLCVLSSACNSSSVAFAASRGSDCHQAVQHPCQTLHLPAAARCSPGLIAARQPCGAGEMWTGAAPWGLPGAGLPSQPHHPEVLLSVR